jgi:hypothetical protein
MYDIDDIERPLTHQVIKLSDEPSESLLAWVVVAVIIAAVIILVVFWPGVTK